MNESISSYQYSIEGLGSESFQVPPLFISQCILVTITLPIIDICAIMSLILSNIMGYLSKKYVCFIPMTL